MLIETFMKLNIDCMCLFELPQNKAYLMYSID